MSRREIKLTRHQLVKIG